MDFTVSIRTALLCAVMLTGPAYAQRARQTPPATTLTGDVAAAHDMMKHGKSDLVMSSIGFACNLLSPESWNQLQNLIVSHMDKASKIISAHPTGENDPRIVEIEAHEQVISLATPQFCAAYRKDPTNVQNFAELDRIMRQARESGQ